MRREDFEHVSGAAANVTGEDEFVVIGSQAVLGPFPDAPDALLRSIEADIYPLADPAGWEGRLVRVPIPARVASRRNPVAWCLEPHDLVLAKCVAGRERDWLFTRDMLRAGLVRAEVLVARIDWLPVDEPTRAHVRSVLNTAIQATTAVSD